jgi:phospholipase/lecithinase/hemolysin
MEKNMRYNKIIWLVTFFAFFISSQIWAKPNFNQVYVFGDSLSDTGNLASVIGPFPSPPFYQNRVSNGPVGIEILAEMLGTTANASLHLIAPEAGSNYAVAGAKAAGVDAIDLPAQLSIFLANHAYTAPADALYVIFIGANDIRSARSILDKPTARAVLDLSIQQIKSTLDTLVSSGAKSFLIINAPDIGVLPETQILSVLLDDPKMPARASKLSKYFRNKLDDTIEPFEENESIELFDFDLYKVFNKLIKKSEKYGFTNNSEACFSSLTFTFNAGCNFGANFDQYVFFDEIHPTARVHSIIGNAIYSSLENEEDESDD